MTTIPTSHRQPVQGTLTRLPSTLLCCMLALASSARANWPHWRGPHYTGATEERNLPSNFSKSENIIWKADLPGSSAATPIIWGDHVFISSVHDEARALLAMAYDRKSGKLLWQKEIGVGIRKDDRSNYASPSPVTDGTRVYFFYGNGDLIAFDFDGTKVWSRNLQKDYGDFAFLWTFSTSPTLVGDKLVMQVLQRDEPVQGRGRTDGPIASYLVALDAKSGSEIWKTVRPSEAKAESLEAFTTPIPVVHAGVAQLLVAGGDCLTSHETETGKEIWRWGTWNPTKIGHWRLVPSPVAGGGVVLACGPKQEPVYAIKLGRTGTLDEGAIAWESPERGVSSDVATPLFYQGHFYILNGDRDNIAKVEPATGKVIWLGEFGKRVKIESSPTAADGKIYVLNTNGDAFVLDAGESFKVLHSVEMGDEGDKGIRSSIAISRGQLFVRTGRHLYCVGQ